MMPMRKHLIATFALAALLAPGLATAQTFKSSAGDLKVDTIAKGLVNPWALAFLPDGGMLVTERPGRIRIVAKDGTLSSPLANVPKVFAVSQGGLLDLVLDRNFAQNKNIYFSYAEPFDGGGRTALARAKLDADTPKLDDVKVIYRQEGPASRGNHFGGRIAQSADGNIFLTNGEHFTDRDKAQTLDNDLGKIVRITPDGAAPKDNPFVGKFGARPEIWSYGHRNIQAAAINPRTGKLWTVEHGAKGGDEINTPKAGKDYGWPTITYGEEYSGKPIGDGITQHEGMEQPIYYWDPVIAPSGLAFYNADLFPAWKGSLFVGGMKGYLVRLTLKDKQVVGEERLLSELNFRIRDVVVGPDGALYLVTDEDDGRVLRMTPKR